jgi:hypothetical protein
MGVGLALGLECRIKSCQRHRHTLALIALVPEVDKIGRF